MSFTDWQPGAAYHGPVYLDAGVVAASLARSDRRYDKAVQVIGELLTARLPIILSVLCISESLWALAKMSYCDLNNQPYTKHFSTDIYRRWGPQIFEAYGSRMAAAPRMIQDLADAGVPIQIVPKTEADFHTVSHLSVDLMSEHNLSSADASHLAIVETLGGSLITTDSEFQRAANRAVSILHLAP